MNLVKRLKINSLVVFVLGVVVAAGLVVAKPKPVSSPIEAASATPADVIVVNPEDRSLKVYTQGTVTARREIDIVAQVSGMVAAVEPSFVDGGFFSETSQLLKIEDQDYQLALVKAESKVADAQQLLATERGRERVAKREWRDLGDKDANDLFLRKPQLASAQATVRAAEAELDQARLNLERTNISGPFDGRIRETYVDLGQYVTAGTKIARAYSTDVVEVRLPLSDRQVALLDLPLSYQSQSEMAEPVAVTLTGLFGGKQWQWQGKITRTEATIDVKSRMVYAIAEVAMPFSRLEGSKRPPLTIGQYVEAEIDGELMTNIVTLPRQALHPENKIWVLDADDRINQLSVSVLQSSPEQVVVHGDLLPGTRVVISSLAVNVAGMKVAPIDKQAIAIHSAMDVSTQTAVN